MSVADLCWSCLGGAPGPAGEWTRPPGCRVGGAGTAPSHCLMGPSTRLEPHSGTQAADSPKWTGEGTRPAPLLTDRLWVLGSDHPPPRSPGTASCSGGVRLGARTGRLPRPSWVLAHRERVLGHDHPDRLSARDRHWRDAGSGRASTGRHVTHGSGVHWSTREYVAQGVGPSSVYCGQLVIGGVIETLSPRGADAGQDMDRARSRRMRQVCRVRSSPS